MHFRGSFDSAPSAVPRDKSARRFAQDDDFVGGLKKNTPNRLTLVGLRHGLRSVFPLGLNWLQSTVAGVELVQEFIYFPPAVARALSTARTTALALFTDSSYSSSGTESATMPPPAWM
ncbi:MAG: hypothetical protein QOH35_3378 [Acidobacteriaceae bacterium]|nr:hypothetical protein [Acidobacteriaceae bacterium]